MSFRHGWRISIGLLLIFCSWAQAASPLCSRDRKALLHEFNKPENRLAFKNRGGLLNGGVCWWHSRLQRSAIYLSQFAPEQPKPSDFEAKRLIRHLVRFDSVVTIPGYSNFSEFSQAYESFIQRELEIWQIEDGFIYQQWIRGLYGRSQMPAKNLKRRMDRIYSSFSHSKPGIWLMTQLKGITSHALLLIGMEKIAQGYRLTVIDSNRPKTNRELIYTEGDRSIALGNDRFTPFSGFYTDQDEIDDALDAFCSSETKRSG